MESIEKSPSTAAGISTDIILNQWLGHRELTRRVIDAFPEDALFTYSIGGMRPFASIVKELLTMGAPGIKGVLNRSWDSYQEIESRFSFSSKEVLLKLWDQSTEEIKTHWVQIPADRFLESDKFFGQYEGPIYWSILYTIDNEIHHRAQGYVYLRSLGIEPPPFWDRN